MSNPTGPTSPSFSWITAIICLLCCAYYFFFFFNRAHVELEIQVKHKTSFKLYWADGENSFSEKRQGVIKLSPDQKLYGFFLTNLDNVQKLRVDPFQYAGTGTIKRITISQKGFKPVTINFEDLKPQNDIVEHQIGPDGLKVTSAGKDPFFEIAPDIIKASTNWWLEAVRYILICVLVFVVIRGCSAYRQDFLFVPILLCLVLVLIITMAVISKRNAHPDEYVHIQAAQYYQDNWLPPKIADKEIVHTYSAYGISRLNNGEIYYLLVGKFYQLVKVVKASDLFLLRLFNILLFAGIVLYASLSVPARFVAIPFLISPQVWYIFSYCVSDAFGIFLCFLAACELVRPKSLLNRIFNESSYLKLVGAMVWVAVLLAMLFLLKINYYPFILLCFGVVAFRWLQGNEISRKMVFLRITTCIVFALLLAGLRMGADYHVNGMDRQDKLAAMQEKTAHHWYKPSTELHKKHVSMYLKDRGTSLKELVVNHRWFKHSFVTSFGVYGYFTISAPQFYYRLVVWASLIFAVYTFTALMIRGDMEIRALTLFVTLLGIGLIGASLHRSWTIDLQAQGRYLFPILPMMGVVFARSRVLLNSNLFILVTMQLYLLSLYSFIFVALRYIPRPV